LCRGSLYTSAELYTPQDRTKGNQSVGLVDDDHYDDDDDDVTLYGHIKSEINGPLYINTVIGTLAVDG